MSDAKRARYLRSAVRILQRRAFDRGMRDASFWGDMQAEALAPHVDACMQEGLPPISIPAEAATRAARQFPHLLGDWSEAAK